MYLLNASGYDGKKSEGENKDEMKKPIQRLLPVTRDGFDELSLSLTHGIYAFVSGGDLRFHPKGLPSWLVFFGTAFLVLVAHSNYTAKVTTLSLIQTSIAMINSLDEGLDRHYSFCGLASMQESLQYAYPALIGRYIALADQDPFSAMDRRLCDAAIVDVDSWERAKREMLSFPESDSRYGGHPGGSKRYHCDTKVMLRDVVYRTDIVLAVREDLQNPMSWAFTRAKDLGKWKIADENGRATFLDPDPCGATTDDLDLDSIKLDFWHGSGIIFLSLMLSATGLLLNTLWRVVPRHCQQDASSRSSPQMSACGNEADLGELNQGTSTQVNELDQRLQHTDLEQRLQCPNAVEAVDAINAQFSAGFKPLEFSWA